VSLKLQDRSTYMVCEDITTYRMEHHHQSSSWMHDVSAPPFFYSAALLQTRSLCVCELSLVETI
jgi:hypothetical protein